MKRAKVIHREAQLIEVLTQDGKKLRGIPLGKLRKREKVYAGDTVLGKEDSGSFLIEKIEPRKNLLPRPPVANVDSALIVATLKEPEFNNFLLDNLLAVYEYFGVEPIIVFNKTDLLAAGDKKKLKSWIDIYKNAGYEVLKVSAKRKEGIEEVKRAIRGGTCILAGASGVGKSSLLKALTGNELKTAEVSKKTGRGRHTTTGVVLVPLGEDTFLGDTPGFSKVDATLFIDKRELPKFFRELSNFTCKYSDCTHTKEPGCGVKEALQKGLISSKRYESYLRLLNAYA